MTPEDRLRRLIEGDALAHNPRDGHEGISRYIARRRKVRSARRIGIPAGAIAAVLAIVLPLVLAGTSSRNTVDLLVPPSTTAPSTSSTASTTETPTTTPSTTAPATSTTATNPYPGGPNATTTTPTTAADSANILTGHVYNQQGAPVAGAAIYDGYFGDLIHTGSDGQFSIRCAVQPGGGLVDDDFLWVASWLPNLPGTPTVGQDPRPADPSAGWTYVNPTDAFVDNYADAPVCADLPNPIRIVLPPAGSLNITGNWPPGTAVSVYSPGLPPQAATEITTNQSYGVDTPAQMIESAIAIPVIRWWNAPSSSNGATFTALSATGYSIWVGNQLATNCADIQVLAGQVTDVTCSVSPPNSTTTTTTPAAPVAG